jgi:acid phosphatase type 7
MCNWSIMENSGNYCNRGKCGKILVLFFIILSISFSSDAGSIREVSQGIDRVKSVGSSFQFAVIGDNRDGNEVYTRLIKQILERNPQFIIHLGDMIPKPGEKEWQEFFEISKPIDLPFFPVVGNHETWRTPRGEAMYRRQFALPGGKTYYAFRAGNGLFVILDSEKGDRKIEKEQRSWLEETLLSSKEVFKFVFLHRPLFPPADSLKLGRAMDRYPSDRDNIHGLFLRSKVKAVFAADDHRYDRSEEGGILYLITGGGGAPIYALKNRGGYFHYVWISVREGRMAGEAVDVDGQVQDRFVIE